MVTTTFDEQDDGDLPASLRGRLDTFPAAAIRDEPDRLAAMAEELTQVSDLLDDMGIAGDEQRRVLDRYLKALCSRLAAAGTWPAPVEPAEVGVVTVAQPHGMPPPVSRASWWLRSRIGRPMAVWTFNRRVGRRRRKWRRLLTVRPAGGLRGNAGS